jgi:hypothetical protein
MAAPTLEHMRVWAMLAAVMAITAVASLAVVVATAAVVVVEEAMAEAVAAVEVAMAEEVVVGAKCKEVMGVWLLDWATRPRLLPSGLWSVQRSQKHPTNYF